jgi:restriction system protein
MARRSGVSVIKAIARNAARAQRESVAYQKRQIRERVSLIRDQERQRRQADINVRRLQAQTERERKQIEKEEKQQYLELRLEEVSDRNKEIVEIIEEYRSILDNTLEKNDNIEFSTLRIIEEFPPFIPPQDLIITVTPPDKQKYLQQVKPRSFLENALGMEMRYEGERAQAETQYNNALNSYNKSESEKKIKLEELKIEFENNKLAFQNKVMQRDQEVTELETSYKEGEASAIIAYTTMVFERSEYPDKFPQSFRLAFSNESKEMVIEYELPWIDVIPMASEFKYIKAKDIIEEKPKKPIERKEIYQDIVASIALRSIHEVLEADQGKHIQVVTFSGFVTTVDPATGKDIRPCLVSVRTTKDAFLDINLKRIDKQVCLRNLGAQVSSNPDERQPVKPVVEFDMVDRRFVEQSDLLSGLESRPNLMDLNPTEFEHLVSNLFGKMGLETKLTRASKDGGVDAVAFDLRPILGGKVIIQAKRYKNTVGVSAVRDLYGTMLNEGASKGILVTTSSYGPDAYEFSKDKPMELIDGGGLLYLLDQVGFKAKIIMPQE